MSKQDNSLPHLYLDELAIVDSTFKMQKTYKERYGDKAGGKKSPFSKQTFHALSLSEKIGYLLSRPTFMPNMYCEILMTDEKHYRGVLVEASDSLVTLRQKHFQGQVLEINKISDIRLLGFSPR